MQKAPVMKGSGLKPLEDTKPNEEVHVFGRNLEERVVTKDEEEESVLSIHTTEEDDIESIRKRKFDAITGEEDEETIFQSDFKLFVWDLTTSNWIEKGRGQLRLNDSNNQDERRSRLIMRVSGTLRIILNVAIKRSYFRVLANSKTNIRFTDSQTVWAASGGNAHQLKDLIEERLMSTAEEEESEIRKRSKSAGDDGVSSKKTKAESDSREPSLEETSENESTQRDSNKNEVDVSKSETVDSSDNHISNTASDSDANDDNQNSDKQCQEEESKTSESTNERNIKSNGGEESHSDSEGKGE